MPRARAPKLIEKLQNVDVNVGKTAIIDCVCEGDPEPDCDWFFEGKLIKDEGRFRYLFEKDDVIGLEIRKVTVEDEGEYKVVAFNKSGEVTSKCELLVNDPSKKSSPKKTETKSSAADDFKAQGRVFTPAGRKKKKKKLPIDREDIKAENPEKYYTFEEEEIGRGKFSVVKKATHKSSGEVFAAKIIKFDKDSLKFAIREYDIMLSEKFKKIPGLAKLKEAYLVRKYLILIMDLVEGKTLLDYVSHKHSLTEDDVASYIKQICEILKGLHENNFVHLDIRPTNIRFVSNRDLMILDYNSARHLANKKAGEVVDVIGDTEFCAPEMLGFEPVTAASDMWSVAVIMYILLSGISPFYYADEDQVLISVQTNQWSFDEDAFENITREAKDFIKKCFVRAPEMRMNSKSALEHPWLSADYQNSRKRSKINALDEMQNTDERLYSEEEDDYVEASLVFRTFEEEEYESPEESEEEDED